MPEDLWFRLGDFKISVQPCVDLKKIYLEFSSLCNLNCPMCFRGTIREKRGVMSLEVFNRIFEEKLLSLKWVVIGGMGEPLTNPEALEMIARLKRKKLHVRLSTNGFLLTDDLIKALIDMEVDEIFISCETGDIGHPSLEVVLELIREISSRRDALKKGKPVLGVSTVLTTENIWSFPRMSRNIELAGANSIVISNLIPVKKEHAGLVLYEDGAFREEEVRSLISSSIAVRLHADIPYFSLKTERHCPFVLDKALVVRWDGEVSPCYRFLYTMEEHYFGKSKLVKAFSFGNVLEEPLSRIWIKKDYIWFRFKVSWALFPSCTDCKFRECCHFLEEVERDCWGNSPSCADCLWWRGIAICP